MDILTTSLFLVMGAFAIRGGVLGFVALISRIISLISAYIISLVYRGLAAEQLALYVGDQIPIILTQVIAGVLLFVCTYILVGTFIQLMITIMRKASSQLDAVFKRKTVAGRLSGAGINATIGAAIFLLGVWAYGLVSAYTEIKPLPDSSLTLQKIANSFGDKAFGMAVNAVLSSSAKSSVEESVPILTNSETIQEGTNKTISSTVDAVEESGIAVIVSESEPEKNVYVYGDVELPEIVPAETSQARSFTRKKISYVSDEEVKASMGQHQLVSAAAGGTDVNAIDALMTQPDLQQEMLEKLNALMDDPEALDKFLQENMPGGSGMAQMLKNPAMQQEVKKQIGGFMQNPDSLQKTLSDPKLQQMLQGMGAGQ